MTNAKNIIANKDRNSNTIFSDIKSWFKYFKSYFFNLFVKNKINKNIPAVNHRGEFSFRNVYKNVNNKDNMKIFNRLLNLFPINIDIKVNPSDNKRLKLKLRLVKFKPCKVAIIVQIPIIVAKKIDDANKVIIKALNFICPSH